MVTIKFNSAGGTQDVSYSMTCNKKPTFSVPNEYTSWLKINSVSATEPKITVSAATYSGTIERTGYVFAKIDGNTCDEEGKQLMVVQDPPSGEQEPVKTTLNSRALSPQGGTNEVIGYYSATNPEDFDINDLDASSSSSWGTVTFTEPVNGQGDILLTYTEASQARSTSIGTFYKGKAVGNVGEYDQGQNEYTPGLYFKITADTFDMCGNSGQEIGEYGVEEGYIYASINNYALTCTTLSEFPWITQILFETPQNDIGKIVARYNMNDTGTVRKFDNIAFTYDGYLQVKPASGSKTEITQDAIPSQQVGSCGQGSNPGTAPSTCGDISFYHWDHPYVPGDGDYYYLEHDVTAEAQDYELRTSADYNIQDPMWRDVRVEIWDVTPFIVHRSACGSHYVEVEKNKTFDQIISDHEKICSCWAPQSGEYVIEGYSTSLSKQMVAFEGGRQVEKDDKYDSFWFKAKYDSDGDMYGYGVNSLEQCYGGGDCYYRSIKFEIARNTGDKALDRCVIIKVYPKIGGSYCTGNCKSSCESSGKCGKNCCITDMVVQEAVDCANSKTYFKLGIEGHAYSPRYIQTKRSESLTNQMLYQYWWGPCDDNPIYVNAVDVYDAQVIRSTDTGNIKHTQYIGEYLGSIFADNNYDNIGGRSKFPYDDCITNISFSNPLDEKRVHRGLIQISANGYVQPSREGENGEHRYRVRILVPYHKGTNYYNNGAYGSKWKFKSGDEYYTWYGPKELGYDGLSEGIFCVLEQDGRE